MAQTKLCRGCGETKPINEFDVRSDTGRPRARCKPCRRIAQNQRNARLHPPRDRGPARVAGTAELLRCTRCGGLKPAVDFPPIRRGEEKLQTWCRSCFAEVNARNYGPYYERQRSRIAGRVRARLDAVRREILAYLVEHPCVDCGESDIVVLEFDHLRDKVRDVTAMVARGWSWKKIRAEMAKCEIRCANCHRRATAERHSKRIVAQRRRARRHPRQLVLSAAITFRRCRECQIDKPLTAFPYRSIRANTHHWICLDCQRVFSSSWYANHTGRPVRRRGGRGRSPRRQNELNVLEHLRRNPCVDCGESDPLLLDFDHLRDKRVEVSTLVRSGATWNDIASEIAKCVVRCANCHRRRTIRTIHGYRIRLTDIASESEAQRPRRDSNARPTASKAAALIR